MRAQPLGGYVEIVCCAVRWYCRFQFLLDIEELLFERAVIVRYETIRRRCDMFGAGLARRVNAARRRACS
ncbi:transposase (fragment) [Paraburkholderia piptadeniae]|uniref:Transposase n=1 Tax=Paraburkholderia piptadeniae TaxID=1701573 RepID=A0A1N7SXF0_9BURK